jgi:[acyl-carrier-protein] S-malonyltransferase
MQSAETELRAAAQGIQTGNPTLQLWSNNSGQLVESGDEFLRLLVSQVASPVRWDLCMASIDAEGVQVVELPPAGALAGLAKRGMPNTLAVALKTPADLEKIAQ